MGSQSRRRLSDWTNWTELNVHQCALLLGSAGSFHSRAQWEGPHVRTAGSRCPIPRTPTQGWNWTALPERLWPWVWAQKLPCAGGGRKHGARIGRPLGSVWRSLDIHLCADFLSSCWRPSQVGNNISFYVYAPASPGTCFLYKAACMVVCGYSGWGNDSSVATVKENRSREPVGPSQVTDMTRPLRTPWAQLQKHGRPSPHTGLDPPQTTDS